MSDATLSQMIRRGSPAAAAAAGRLSPILEVDKMIAAAEAQGFRNIQKGQITSRKIYDTLPLVVASNVLKFFENCGSRTFPRTNLSQNRLEVNEVMVIAYINFHIVTFSAAGALPVVSIEPLSTTFAGMYRSDFSIFLSNQQVIKPTPLDTQNPAFNYNSHHTTNEAVKMQSHLVIPPQTEFIVPLQTTNTTTSTTKEIQCVMEGIGFLNSPTSKY
jgi:hypothetical protein